MASGSVITVRSYVRPPSPAFVGYTNEIVPGEFVIPEGFLGRVRLRFFNPGLGLLAGNQGSWGIVSLSGMRFGSDGGTAFWPMNWDYFYSPDFLNLMGQSLGPTECNGPLKDLRLRPGVYGLTVMANTYGEVRIEVTLEGAAQMGAIRSEVGSGTVTLSWDPVPEAGSYLVQWYTASDFAYKVVTETSLTVANLSNTFYTFSIEGLTADGKQYMERPALLEVCPANSRFSKHMFNSIIFDKKTGLQWYSYDGMTEWTWYRVKASATSMSSMGWRFPTLAQLKELGTEAAESGLFAKSLFWAVDIKDTADNPDTPWEDTSAWAYNGYTGEVTWGYRRNDYPLDAYRSWFGLLLVRSSRLF